MAINKKLIHFEKRENFDTRLANNEINDTSIVFIQDTGELWTHGQFFCTTATNLLEAPVLTTSGDTIAVQIGDKTSNYIVPPAAQKGRTMYECITATTDTRGHWTGTIPGVTELYDGLVIHVRFTTSYYGNSEGYNTLNINGLGPKLVWWRYSSILTTHWGSNAEVTLTYRTTAGSYKVGNANGELTNGTTYTDGWVADYAYYTDGNYLSGSYYYRYKVNANGYIGRYMIVMRCPDGTITGLTTTNNSTATTKTMFSGPLLLDDIHYYASTNTYAATSVFMHDGGNMRDNYSLIDVRYTFNCGSTLVANKPFFIVGNIGNDGYFYLDQTQPWALDYPTTEDNKLYILIGPCYDTYRVNFELFKPIYIYKNGKLQLYSQYASETEWANITGKPSTFTPSTHTHPYTDLTGSTTTADQAIVSSGTANGWILKTLGSHAFDSTAYLPLTGGTLTGTLNIDSNTIGQSAHLTFNREYSYIQNKASSGKFAFLANNATASASTSDLIIADGVIYPGTSGHTSLGNTNNKFSQLHLSSAAYIGGALSASGVITFTGLLEGSSAPTDNTEFITSYAGDNGFQTTNQEGRLYRRKASLLYNYIKGKTDSLYSAIGHNHNDSYVTSVGVTDDTTNHANQLRYVKNGASTYFTVPFATNATNATSATTAANLNKSTLGYLYQSATTTTSSTGTVTATSGKIGVPIQFYGSQVNYALNNDLFYATVASNTITANTIYLGDDIKSKTFVKTSTHVPTGASSGSSSSGTSGESITYTAGDGIRIAGTQISTNTWTGTESQFAELANPSSYDLIYIIED